ncbi:LOW QUALITY PROTEIN: cartilage oligomeric matrix protein [Pocillopora verrucosa]|uniref:LOW QUALITY PROTEIN: cartilage oligomeric matrix protein n=1 Tax=Pocillopora verrucosa TaxID=203993 RepID=UPI0033411C81
MFSIQPLLCCIFAIVSTTSLTPATAAEIDLFEVFGINSNTEGVNQVQGLYRETGNAFKIGKHLPRMELSRQVLDTIRRMLIKERQIVVVANLKVKDFSHGTLFSMDAKISGKTLLSVWISCYRTCRLGITYQTSELKIREASFHHIGALSDGKWHKIALHIFPHSHPKKTLAGLYVDCKMRGRRQLLTQIEEFFPSSSKISQDIVFLFGRRSGKTDSAMLTWKGSLQNVKFVFDKQVEELMNSTSCLPPSPSDLLEGEGELFSAGSLYSPQIRGQPRTPSLAAPGAPSLQYSTQDLMMVLVNMQKEAQRREESLQRSLLHVKERLQSQSDDLTSIKKTLESGVCSRRAFSPGRENVDKCSLKPCFPFVECVNTPDDGLGFKCGECPPGYTGDGMRCDDVDECLYSPCSPHATCTNLQPGFKCSACPKGFLGNSTVGIGRDFAEHIKQLCHDVDECNDGRNGGCSVFSTCINTQGSYSCGACQDGYVGDPHSECVRVKFCSGDPKTNPCGRGAECIPTKEGAAFECRCKPGLAGNGFVCGNDQDMDGIPDEKLSCTGDPRCMKDNCRNVPNSEQEDVNKNGVGDMCELDVDGDRLADFRDNCPHVFNRNQRDTDRDGIGNDCDNCPDIPNREQNDADSDGIGDACDPDIDGDGLRNIFDNCPAVPNRKQANKDGDAFGDACDNCPFTPNSNQNDKDNDGWGDACDVDRDYDDDERWAPTKQERPSGTVNKKGNEIQQAVNSIATMLIGKQIFRDVEYSGTFFVNTESDDDIIGIVFGYQSPKKFFVASWKQKRQIYWDTRPIRATAESAVNIKKINSISGPSRMMRNVLWHTGNVSNEVSLSAVLFEDQQNGHGWHDKTAYRWQLVYMPSKSTMRLKIWRKYNKLMMDSGVIKDPDIRGGKLGVMCFSQEKIIWSAISTRCLDPLY